MERDRIPEALLVQKGLIPKGLESGGLEVVGNGEGEGVRPPLSGIGPETPAKPLTAAEIELEKLNRQVGAMVDRSILVSGGVVQCKTPADLARLYELRRQTLGLGPKSEGGKSGPLIQVQFLSQAVANRSRSAPAIEAQAVAITETGNESGSESGDS